MAQEFEFFVKADLKRYEGKYIAIIDQKVVASGDNAKEVLEAANKKYPGRKPLLAKVPKEDALILEIRWK